MRYFPIVIMLLCILACKRKEKSAEEKVNLSKDTIAKPVKQPVATKNPIPDYPSDSMFTAKILIQGGVFHEDEVDPLSDKYKWMGLFKTDTGYYIALTQIKLKREFDAILDSATQKTGWHVYTAKKDTSVILISGLKYLTERRVDSIAFKNSYLLPGEHEDFIFKGVKYTLFATGKTSSSPTEERSPIGISDYKLFIKANINGKLYEQMIVSIASFDDAICSISFLGDIDGDGKPDIILDTTNHYNMSRPTLYLTKPADDGQLIKPVGWFVMVGC